MSKAYLLSTSPKIYPGRTLKEIDEKSNDLPPEKPKLSEIACAIELLECWSLFDNNGVEIRQSLSLVSKMFDKHTLETKKQLKMVDFFKK